MIYSDTTNNSGLIQECEFLTQLGDTNISGNTANLKTFTRLINKWYGNVATWILESQDEWDFDDSNKTTYPILTSDLVADQQDYALPGDILKIKRVQVALDGSNFRKAEPFDISESGKELTTTSIAQDFNTNEPFYDFAYDAVFLYPIPQVNVTAGLKIWISREVDKFVTGDTTKEPGFDDNFHQILSYGASYEWSLVKKKPQATDLKQVIFGTDGTGRTNGLKYDLQRYSSNKQKDRNYTFKSADQDME